MKKLTRELELIVFRLQEKMSLRASIPFKLKGNRKKIQLKKDYEREKRLEN